MNNDSSKKDSVRTCRETAGKEKSRVPEEQHRKAPRYPVFHVPHAGNLFPSELLASVCVKEETFRRYHSLMSDTEVWRFVPEEYRRGDMYERFPVSRLLCDVERFIGPDEEMEQYGMGFCYEKAFDGTVIKAVTEEAKELTRKHYDRHHARMDRICEKHPRILLLDIHSFSEECLPQHIRQRTDQTPDVCIGTDPEYTPQALVSRIERCLDEINLLHRVNAPYSGTFVPNAVLKRKCACELVSVMLEFNKKLYCDGNGKPEESQTEQIRNLVRRIVTDCLSIG